MILFFPYFSPPKKGKEKIKNPKNPPKIRLTPKRGEGDAVVKSSLNRGYGGRNFPTDFQKNPTDFQKNPTIRYSAADF